jgi:hypothetical protein
MFDGRALSLSHPASGAAQDGRPIQEEGFGGRCDRLDPREKTSDCSAVAASPRLPCDHIKSIPDRALQRGERGVRSRGFEIFSAAPHCGL